MKTKRNKNKIAGKLLITAAIFVFLLTSFFQAQAAVNKMINYQGKLTNTGGWAVPDGNYDMRFELYNAATNGDLLWTGTHTAANGNAVAVSRGIFSLLLGSGAGNALNLNFETDSFYLQVQIYNTDTSQWETFNNRKRIGSVPQAINALNVIGDGNINISNISPDQSAANITYNPASGANSAMDITYGSGGGTGIALKVAQLGSGYAATFTGGFVGIGTSNPSQLFQVNTNASNPIVITSGGNIGIGITSPNAKLDIRGGINAGTNGTEFIVSVAGVVTGGTYNGVTITSGTGTLTLNAKTLNISNSLTLSGVDGKTINFGANNLTFSTTGDYTLTIPATGTAALGTGTANYTARWIDTNTLATGIIWDNGTNVGIGTTAPVDKLEIANGGLTFSATTTGNNGSVNLTINAGSTGTTATLLVKLDMSGTVVTTDTTTINDAIGVALDTKSSGQAVRVATQGIVTVTADNAVAAGDYIGIGTSTAGRAKSLGANYPTTSGILVIGRALGSAAAGNTFLLILSNMGGGISGGGTVEAQIIFFSSTVPQRF